MANKADGKLIHTPVEGLVGNPSNRKGSPTATYDGEPGFPGRSKGNSGVPEITYDKMGGYNPEKPKNVGNES